MVKMYKSGNAFMIEQAFHSSEWINLWNLVKPREEDSRSNTPSSFSSSPTPLSLVSGSSSLHSLLDELSPYDRYPPNMWRFWHCPHMNYHALPEFCHDMSQQSFHMSMFDKFKKCLRKSETHLYSLEQLKCFSKSYFTIISSFVDTHPTIDQNYGGESFFCFREGILPLWEDEFNVNGGCWSLKLSDHDLTSPGINSKFLWLRMIQFISSSEMSHFLDEICGIGLTVRKVYNGTHYKLTLWNRDSNQFFVNLQIGNLMRNFLGFRGTLIYLSHSTNINKFAATAKRKYHYRLRNAERQISFYPDAYRGSQTYYSQMLR